MSRAARRQSEAGVVPVDRIRAHPRNVRRDLGDLRELTASIRAQGILVPLLLERRGDHYRILHGHRRWTAARMAGVTKVPAFVVDEHADDQAIVVMLTENEHKAKLTAADRQHGVQMLRGLGWTMQQIADELGIAIATAYEWAKGEKVKERPSYAARAAARGTGTRTPRVPVTSIHEVIQQWEGRAPAPLIEELRKLLGKWKAPTQAVEPAEPRERALWLMDRGATEAEAAQRVGVPPEQIRAWDDDAAIDASIDHMVFDSNTPTAVAGGGCR